jgi:hypothetical protein
MVLYEIILSYYVRAGTVAERSKARSEAWTVDSNPTQGMDV